MNVRHAKEDDIERILELLSSVLDIHHKGRPDVFKPGTVKYTKDELKTKLYDENAPIFVAEISARVVGYAFCVTQEIISDNILYDAKSLYIDDLCVDENERGRGIGTALYNHVCDYAKSIECTSITLNVWECNASARKFYEKLGLTPRKTLMEKKI